MDLWNAFVAGEPPRPPVLQGTTRGRIVCDKPHLPEPSEKVLDGRIATQLEDEVDEVRGQLHDRLKIVQSQPLDLNNNAEVPLYKKYKFDRVYSESKLLPIYSAQSEILTKIATNPTVVIEGSTGCGKSTQV